MDLPQTNCCRCFAPGPRNQFTRVTRKKVNGGGMKHKVNVPMCDDCFRHAQIRWITEWVTLIGGVVLIFGIISLIVSVAENGNGDFSVASILGIAFVACTIGIIVTFGLQRYLLGKDYMHVTLRFQQMPRLHFTNDQYQALYEQKHPYLKREK